MPDDRFSSPVAERAKADRFSSPAIEPPKRRPFAQQVARTAGLTGRAVVEGVTDLALPLTAPLTYMANQIPGVNLQNTSDAMSSALTSAGAPVPENDLERGVNTAGRFVSGVLAGGPISRMVAGAAGAVPKAPQAPPSRMPSGRPVTPQGVNPSGTYVPPPGGSTGGAMPRIVGDATHRESTHILQENGVRLSAANRTGSRAARMAQDTARDHPMEADRTSAWMVGQLRDYTRAVLKHIGEDADNALAVVDDTGLTVMGRARQRLGNVFNTVARRGGAAYDDVLRKELDEMMEQAASGLDEASTEFRILQNNYEKLMRAVDEGTGKINGEIFLQLRSTMSNLSSRDNISPFARKFDDILMQSLVRANPQEAARLRTAITQWRNMLSIEGAISKDMQGLISPASLSGAWTTKANRAASVYGLGGDQSLIRLARAGRGIILDSLPNSGTAGRTLMNAPVRSILTSPIVRGMQNANLGTPGFVARSATQGRSYVPGAAAASTNALGRE